MSKYRLISFRGYSYDSKEWVYGFYQLIEKTHFIIEEGSFEKHRVDPDSIGQFTGIRDIDFDPIYEGDKVRCSASVPFVGTVVYSDSKFECPNPNLWPEDALEFDSKHLLILGYTFTPKKIMLLNNYMLKTTTPSQIRNILDEFKKDPIAMAEAILDLRRETVHLSNELYLQTQLAIKLQDEIIRLTEPNDYW